MPDVNGLSLSELQEQARYYVRAVRTDAPENLTHNSQMLANLVERLLDSEPRDVWVLVIDHKHGSDGGVHVTEASARRALFTFVSDWWETEIHDAPMPDDPEDAIAEYFDRVETESFTITPATVEHEENAHA